jgi:hypothetical protein
MGASAFHDFGTQYGVQQVADHIDVAGGAGPDATSSLEPIGLVG